jgi:predicted PurR-regulated permease PerM
MANLFVGKRRTQWVLGSAVTILVLIGTFVILRPFWIPVAWAVVLAVATWPIFRRLRSLLGGREGLAALIMTLLLVLAIVGPVVILTLILSDEVRRTYSAVQVWMVQGPPEVPAWVGHIPWVGDRIEQWRGDFIQNPQGWHQLIEKYQKEWVAHLLDTGRAMGLILVKAGLTLLTAYFIYRYGDSLFVQTRQVFSRLAGEETSRFLHPIGDTIRAVVYGLLLTALVQGVMAGIGYWVTGLGSPVLLGAATALLALIPFGAPLIWVPSGVYLISQGSMIGGVGLLIWGGLVISWIDNLLRPMFISGSTKIPFLLVFFGLAGGLLAFGMIGLLIGPVILSVIMTLWTEWAEGTERAERATKFDISDLK